MDGEEIKKFREGIPILHEKLYLDNAAMGPLHNDVVNRIHDFHVQRQTKGPDFTTWWNIVGETRGLIADWIHANPKEITFLWNTSAGINLAAQGIDFSAGDEVIIPEKEFPANIYPWLALEERGVHVKIIPFVENKLTAEQIIDAVTDKTKVISVSWVSATNGNMIDLQKLGEFCKNNDIFFVVDAIQGFATNELDVSTCHIDVLVSGFYKWAMGPDGISFVYVNKNAMDKLDMPWVGWASMENPFDYEKIEYRLSEDARRYETGNMNFSAIAGIHEALRLLQPLRAKIYERVPMLTARLRDGLRAIPNISLLSPLDSKSGITLFSGRNIEDISKHNITVNFRSGIRVSPHFYNTEAEIDRFLNSL
ncbi:aminotransferase class V-fold PLP-dependent enzyme [Pseudogracilibacillus sp. SE30717A]|uniref:aminotransferase class V-fold PLP-dependent enzyme n=1 Tax=Pseudogracilibacillus sp. SE30717A TaxID=3098293 RepID=UPI00300DC623